MKFALSTEHREYYTKHGLLELEELLTPAQVDGINQAIQAVLADRLQVSEVALNKQTPSSLFHASRDLWRGDDGIRKIITHRNLIDIVFELVKTKSVRLGFDQLLLPASDLPTEDFSFATFMNSKLSLKEFSCIQTSLGALVLCLTDGASEEQSLFPTKAGSGVFIHPDTLIDFSGLSLRKNQRYLMVGFSEEVSQYLLRPLDPATHALKHRGLVFGDRLTNKMHPLIHL
jgi:hypothetical protein